MNWKKILTREIRVDIKTCMYFFCILFFYCMYILLQNRRFIDMLILLEILAASYVMSYIQTCVFHNFDEGEHFGFFEIFASAACSVIYAGISFLFGWFAGSAAATAWFFAYMLLCMVTIYFTFKIRRAADTKELNSELEQFKKQIHPEGE